MKAINKNSSIKILWKVFRGNNKISENFHSLGSDIHVFLVGCGDTYTITPVINNIVEPGYDVLEIDIPAGKLIEGAYDIKAIWEKNGGRNILTSSRCGIFGITDSTEEAPVKDEEIKIASFVESYGRDGMSAYEIAVMRGITELSEKDWLQGLGLQDGSVTEEKLSSEVVKKLNNKANKASDIIYQGKVDGENVEEALNTVGTRLQSLEQPSTAANLYVAEIVPDGSVMASYEQNEGAMPPQQQGDIVFMTAWGKYGYRVTGRKETTSGYTVYTNPTIVTKDGYKAADYQFAEGDTKVFYCGADKKSYTWASTGNALVEYNKKSSMTLEDLTPTMANIDNVREEVNTITKEVTTVTDEVQNISDEEDLTRVQQVRNGKTYEVLQLKDREYAPNVGMGYVILRQDKTFAEQVTKANTIYEIRYDFDLGGEEVEIPNNCVLKFEGGSLSNGTVIGNNTGLKAEIVEIFINIIIGGSWNINNIYQRWFNFVDFKTDPDYDNFQNFANITSLSSNDVYNNIHFCEGTYLVSMLNATACLNIKSNSSINFGGCELLVKDEELKGKRVISVNNASHVYIYGGKIVGHAESWGDKSGGDQNHGIYIGSSNYISLKDTIITQFTGDGIVISNSNYVDIKNVESTKNNRQGISILSGTNIIISESKFNEQGFFHIESPSSGIDIEPWQDNMLVQNITIKDCEFIGNAGLAFAVHTHFKQSSTHNAQMKIIDCSAEGQIKVVESRGVKIENLKRTLYDGDYDSFYNNYDVVITNTPIGNVNTQGLHNVEFNGCQILNYNNNAPSSNNNENVRFYLCNIDSITVNGDGLIKDSEIANAVISGINTVTNCIINNLTTSSIEGSTISDCTIRLVQDSNGYSTWKSSQCLRNTFIGGPIGFVKSSDEGTCLIEDCTFIHDGGIGNTQRAIMTAAGNSARFILKRNKIVGFESLFYRNYGNEVVEVLTTESIQNAFLNKDFTPLEGCRDLNNGNERVFRNGEWMYINTVKTNDNRPSTPYKGMCHFDTSLSKPIWWTGSKWVDAIGAEVV